LCGCRRVPVTAHGSHGGGVSWCKGCHWQAYSSAATMTLLGIGHLHFQVPGRLCPPSGLAALSHRDANFTRTCPCHSTLLTNTHRTSPHIPHSGLPWPSAAGPAVQRQEGGVRELCDAVGRGGDAVPHRPQEAGVVPGQGHRGQGQFRGRLLSGLYCLTVWHPG